MKISKYCLLAVMAVALTILLGCTKPKTSTKPHLIFKFVFDSTQVRLNGFGQPDSVMPSDHAGQNPQMNVMSAHYIELASYDTTGLGRGTVLYMTPSANGAIDFSKEVLTPNNGVFYSVELDSVKPATYKWLRVSLAYQNYSVKMYIDTTVSYGGYNIPIQGQYPCTIASFIGVNTYITSYEVKTKTISVNGNKLQGYWGFESVDTFYYNYGGVNYSYPYTFVSSGQAPDSATTVVNPLYLTSPIPTGSCVATGQFVIGSNVGPTSQLTITGHETQDIIITVSLSVNKSFEWKEVNHDGKWQPTIGEYIVDMGVRGLVPIIGQ